MKKLLCLLLVVVLFSVGPIFAAPIDPTPGPYQLPDGTEITIQMYGDETFYWTTTEDGFTVLYNSEGFLEYAVKDATGALILSGVRAYNPNERSDADKQFLSTISKSLNYSEPQRTAMRRIGKARAEAMQQTVSYPQRPLVGEVHIPVILVEFPDLKFTKTKEDFDLLLDQLSHKVPGSLRDYFWDNSEGKLDLRVDVFGPYMMPNGINAYAIDAQNGVCPGNPGAMARSAIDMAYADGADFSKYALYGGDSVDCVHIIFAGYGRESKGPQCGSIWSHADAIRPAIEHNGKKICAYSCSPELRGNTGATMTNIGVIGHELGHSLCKLPDFYDVMYAGTPDLGIWCMMSRGNWNGSGATPAKFSAYARHFLGWVPAIDLDEQSDVVMPNPADSGVVYRYSTAIDNEYYLLENRQQTGWDEFLPGSGLLIYRVNKNCLGWVNNYVNGPSCTGYGLQQPGCAGGCGGEDTKRGTDAWPQPGYTEFTDYSTPRSSSLDGTPTNKPITEIQHDKTNRTISFKFRGGTPPPYNDLSVVDVQVPSSTMPDDTVALKVALVNLGAVLENITITWSLDGEEQTPYTWTGQLPFLDTLVLTFDTVKFSGGAHYINVIAVVDNDHAPGDNRLGKQTNSLAPFFEEGFEGTSSDWTMVNGEQVNQWYIGTDAAAKGEQSAYVSNDESHNWYTLTRKSSVHIYKDIEFEVTTDSFDLLFDFRGMGQTNNTGLVLYDYMEIRIVETDVVPVAGENLEAGESLGKYAKVEEWQAQHVSLSPEYSGTTKRMVLSWYNSAQSGEQAPAAIDNIEIASRPETLEVYNIAIDPNSDHTFPTAKQGYEPQEPRTIQITSESMLATRVTMTLTGTGADAFEFSKTVVDIAKDGEDSFTVSPKTGLQEGVYTATVTVSNREWSESFEVSFTVEPPPAANSDLESSKALTVSPNPVTGGELRIENGQWKQGDIAEIYTMTGQCVFTHSLPASGQSSITLNISHLPTGAYVLKIGTASVKVIKQ
ncbi:MAG: M6 family metalloprotease domain-containing protein [Bacteroidales bacterium]|jgi:M6 family metalloprotease-like protein|nr:M6 family metalloprotease domain-containing protein [Bacteroidales bacterium]